jgi:hypothetical protein
LVVWNMFYFSIQLGISSSQLTKTMIFQRGRWLNHQAVYIPINYSYIYHKPLLSHNQRGRLKPTRVNSKSSWQIHRKSSPWSFPTGFSRQKHIPTDFSMVFWRFSLMVFWQKLHDFQNNIKQSIYFPCF